MKKGMNQIQKSLLVVIGVLAIVLAAVLVLKGYSFYQEKEQEKEWEARHQEVQEEIDSVRVQIESLAGNADALQIFLDEQVNSVMVLDEWQAGERDTVEELGSAGQEDGQGPEGQGIGQEDKQEPEGRGIGQESVEGQDGTLEVSSGAIVIGAEETPQAGQGVQDGEAAVENAGQFMGEGQAGIGNGLPMGEGQAETGEKAPMEEVSQQGLAAAADGAIIIDAPPAPKPPAEAADKTVSGNASNDGSEEDTVSGNGINVAEEDGTVSGNGVSAAEGEDTVSGNGINVAEEDGTVSGNGINVAEEDGTVSGNGINVAEEDGTVSGNGVSVAEEDDTVSGNGVNVPEDDDTISGNALSAAEMEGTISGNAVVDSQVIPSEGGGMTLEQRRNIRSSYLETMQMNGEDKAVINNSSYDFSHVKIACLGDSLTAGSNLDNMENYQQYSYPSVLKNILQAEEVYNLGIGGSSYGRYWDKAFVDRYQEIPKDVDIILVMGGTNDGFAASEKELGSLREKKARTFYGDVDELMRGLRKDYPDAKIIFATPLPNVLHDYLRVQRDYLLPQSVYANAIKELAAQYQIDVIDLYNSNLLDTHDAQVIASYMPDGVHGNPAGYQVLAEHMARGIIEIAERDRLGNGAVPDEGMASGSTDGGSEGTVSGNGTADGETVSGNGLDGRTVPEVSEWILSPEDAKRMEEERIRAEKEEAAKAAENNKKVAEDAVVITPSQEVNTEGAAQTGQQTGGEAAGMGQQSGGEAIGMGQQAGGTATDSLAGPEETEPAGNYEYGGEAIVIQ